jgi:hypothetical protein
LRIEPVNWRSQFRKSNASEEWPESYAELWRNMQRPVFSAIPVATFTIPVAVMILAAPFAHAQTDIEDSCKSSGGQYSSEQVTPHFGSAPTLIETCCTNAGASQKCITYRDGVQGPTYGG